MTRPRSYATSWPRWLRLGRWVHHLQRLTGLFLLGFSIWHILRMVEAARDPARLGAVLASLFNPPLVTLVLLAFTLHALNGLRLTLLDLRVAEERQHQVTLAAIGLGLLLFLLAAGWWFS